MDRSFYLSAGKAGTTLCLRIVCAVDLCHISVLVLLKACACHEICAHETYFVAREKTEVLLRRILHEVLTLDIEFSGERNLTLAHLRILQVIRDAQHLCLAFRIVVDDQLYRIEDSHHSRAF